MIGFEEKIICRKVGNIFALASKEFDYYPFIKTWMKSENYKRLLEFDFKDIAQGPLYLYNSFKMENDIKICTPKYYLEDDMFWIGYIFTWMCFEKITVPDEICKKYKMEELIFHYETLHTLPTTVAIEEIEENFKK